MNYLKSSTGYVCFITQPGSVATFSERLERLLNANERLLRLLEATRPRRRQILNDDPPPARAATRTPLPNQETLTRDTDHQFDFKQSREGLKVIYDALHSTWPLNSNCFTDHQPGCLGRECHSARLRISGTWRNGPRDSEQFDLLLCTSQVKYECEVEVNQTR